MVEIRIFFKRSHSPIIFICESYKVEGNFIVLISVSKKDNKEYRRKKIIMSDVEVMEVM